MSTCIHWFEMAFGALPFAFLEVWGRFAYIVGIFFAVAAFSGFTFRLGGGWGLGRERQAWDAKAILSIPVTFLAILATGYIGSFIVLVPGAQTFESLKDLTVFLCIVLFGYPALITVPFAYGLSDLIEGVPPDFLRDWLLGYLINPACFWVAYQLLGKNPDFRHARTWRNYLAFVLVFMSLEPILWGYICAGKFTPEISYQKIASALFFTTSITWLLAPIAMLGALPLARKFGMFWAEIPGHVRERRLRRKELIWEAGTSGVRPEAISLTEHFPIRLLFLVPFIILVLTMVGTTAYVTLHSAEKGATKLAMRLHEEISENIVLQLDEYLEKAPPGTDIIQGIGFLFRNLRVSQSGIALLIDRSGKVLASSAKTDDPLAAKVIANFVGADASPERLKADVQFRFDIISDQPVDRETWLAQTTSYKDQRSGRSDWVVLTAMPESYYLSGVEAGNSRAAMVFAMALMLSLAVTAVLAEMVTGGLRRMSLATQGLARGDLTQRLPGSRLEEMNRLAHTFNDMADRLAKSIDALLTEVALRGKRERELEASEVALAKSNERFALATHAAHMGVWDWEIPADKLVWDGRMNELYGIKRESFTGSYEAWSESMHPEDRDRVDAEIQQTLRGEKPYQTEFRIIWPDGTVRHIGAVGEVSRDAEGKPLRMTGINFDITERMRAEEAQTRLVAIVNSSDDAIISKTLDGVITTWNSGAEKMFGYSAEEAVGKPILMLFPPARFDEEKGILAKIGTGQVVKNFETVRVCKNGKKIDISVTLSPIFDGNGKIIGASKIARDITERKKLEEQINRNQRLESIGNLASGIAHDLNNVLLPIQLALEIMEEKVSDPIAQRLIATMRTSAKRGADIVKQVLSFGRGVEGERVLIEPQNVIDEVMRIIQETFPKSIRIRADVPIGLWTFLGDPTQIHQILLNLGVNARDAMPRGGTLTLSAENVQFEEIDTRMHSESKIGPYVLIKVTDTGEGIPPEIKDKIFEPFFTTKEVGKGTGLGLSTVHSMVKRHDGFLNLYSEVGKGTSFHLYFPADISARRTASRQPGESTVRQGPQGRGELVLLVDDEAEIRDTTALILESNGYRVLCANDGHEAIACYAEHLGEIAVVVTDIMMPNLDGEAAIRELLRLDPLVKIIAVSGLVENTRAALRGTGGSILCLSKPYGAAAILDAVRQIIDGTDNPIPQAP